MGEPFKEMFNRATVRKIGARLAAATPQFPRVRFSRRAESGLLELELKARVDHIVDALESTLDPDPPRAFAQLLAASDPPQSETEGSTDGFWHWPFCTYVERQSLAYRDQALATMHALTRCFSCEFAIRPLLEADPERTLAWLEGLIDDPDPHVRRWISEGTRPRLPWGRRLSRFVAEPGPVLVLLEQLKDDSSEYVRRSVANNLNDIAKDHPDRVAQLAVRWLEGASRERERLVRHGLRSLIKQGHMGALAAIGVGPAQLSGLRFWAESKRVRIGQQITLQLEFRSAAEQQLVIDYKLHYVKASGRSSPKVFKWRSRTAREGEQVSLSKRHPLKVVSVRPLYPGTHRIELLVNGLPLGEIAFELTR